MLNIPVTRQLQILVLIKLIIFRLKFRIRPLEQQQLGPWIGFALYLENWMWIYKSIKSQVTFIFTAAYKRDGLINLINPIIMI